MVGAVRDGRAGYQIMVRDGRMDVHAAALAVGMDRDPAGSVQGNLLAREVAVFVRPLDVFGAALGKLFGGGTTRRAARSPRSTSSPDSACA